MPLGYRSHATGSLIGTFCPPSVPFFLLVKIQTIKVSSSRKLPRKNGQVAKVKNMEFEEKKMWNK